MAVLSGIQTLSSQRFILQTYNESTLSSDNDTVRNFFVCCTFQCFFLQDFLQLSKLIHWDKPQERRHATLLQVWENRKALREQAPWALLSSSKGHDNPLWTQWLHEPNLAAYPRVSWWKIQKLQGNWQSTALQEFFSRKDLLNLERTLANWFHFLPRIWKRARFAPLRFLHRLLLHFNPTVDWNGQVSIEVEILWINSNGIPTRISDGIAFFSHKLGDKFRYFGIHFDLSFFVKTSLA